MSSIIDQISESDALVILRCLIRENPKLTQKIEQIAKKHLSAVHIGDVAENLYFDLNRLEVEELWDRSGKTRYGYVDPGEAADAMFEEVLEPYVDELRKYLKLSMHKEAKTYCKGLLLGIRKFETESNTEFKSWAVDIPSERFDELLNIWKEKQNNQQDIEEMEQFIDSMDAERTPAIQE